MSKVILNKKTVLSLLKKKLSDNELEERITLFGTPIQGINNNEMVIEVFPNRPDLLSEHGFARSLNQFLGYETGLKNYKLYNSNETVIIENSVNKVRPYTACAIVKDLKLNDESIKEIIQLQEKLHITYGRNRKKVAIGIYPLDKIEFPIKFLALDKEKIKFQPLESEKEMTAMEILEKHPAGKEYGNLLKQNKEYPLFVDANNNILSMPPIINSELVGRVTKETKDVFIECSGFNFDSLSKCLNIIVTSLAEMGGKIYTLKLKYWNKELISPNLNNEEINIKIENVNKLLGLKLNENEIKKLLEKMGYNYSKKVIIPAYRIDIIHEIDIIEDIAIAYGYEKFTPEIPNISTIAEEGKFEMFKNKISEILVGLGLLETKSYEIVNSNDQNKKMLVDNELILLENSLNQDYNAMRYSIIPSLLKILSENKHNAYPQNLFEIGRMFKKGESDTNVIESEKLGVIICHNKSNFTEIKQILDSLFNILNLKYEIKEMENNSFIEGRIGKVIVNDKELAYIGEMHPEVLKNFNLDLPVSSLELDLNELFSLIK